MEAFTEAIVNWLQGAFNNNYLVTVIISIIPMIEVRGAITVATNLGMNPWIAYVLSCCSALIVCPILLLFLKPILRALKNSHRCGRNVYEQGQKAGKRRRKRG